MSAKCSETKASACKNGAIFSAASFEVITGVCLEAELDVQERLIEVGDNVFDVFDADRETHQALGDTDAFLRLLGHRSMGHERRQGDKCLDAAEAFRQGAQLHLIEEAACRIQGAKVERQHGPRPALLLACYFMLRV